MSTTHESLLERVPESELLRVPAVVRSRKTAIPTYRFRRLPDIEELKQLTGLWSIWQSNQTMILTDEPTVHGTGVLVYHDSENSSIKCVTLAENRCLWFSSGSLRCTIIGKSDHAIAETAAFLWGLDNDNRFREIRCMNEHFDFGLVSTEQLGLVFRNSPTMQITLKLSNISPVQSEFLAQMPFTISLTLEKSLDSFSDGGHTFVEALHRREKPFGSLKLWKVEDSGDETYQRLLQAEAIDFLEVGCATLRQIRQLLSASVKSVGFTIKVEQSLGLDWSAIDIVPKELSVEFSACHSEAHADCICAFFRRVAELGDFVKLELALTRVWDTDMPSRVAEELLYAVAANQSLIELTLHLAFILHAEHPERIFAVLERHEGLRRVKIDEYSETIDPNHRMLKQLLQRNRFIEVIDGDGNRVTDGHEIDQLYTFNLFFRNAQGLKHEQLSLLPPLVGYALTQSSASCDFRRSALLTAKHVDALCELVLYSSLFSSDAHNPEKLAR